MDSYDFSRETGRPVSPPLPEDYSMGYLPQMSTYSGASQSRNTSVPQPIDFGGTASGYSGSSQSRSTSVPQIEYGGVSQSGGTSRVSQSGGTSRVSQSGGTSRVSLRPSRYGQNTEDVRSKILSELHEEMASGGSIKSYAKRTGYSYDTLKSWHKSTYGTMRDHNSYPDEYKASILSELRQELENKTSTIKSYADKKGIAIRTLSRWRKDEDTSRGT